MTQDENGGGRVEREVRRWCECPPDKCLGKPTDVCRWQHGKVLLLQAEVDALREEVDVLRGWGNKDCTRMADQELERRRDGRA